jgi:hypothetical protein
VSKYVYKPIDEVVHSLYTEMSEGIDKRNDFPNGLTAELHVTADSDSESEAIRIMISHLPSWELVRKED